MALTRKKVKKVPFLSPEAMERILTSAQEHPDLGVRLLTRMLKGEGIETSESTLRKILYENQLHTRELRLRRLEDLHLREGVNLSDAQRHALEKFNPCLRERQMGCLRPGALLVLDIISLGTFPKIGLVFLHVAIDPSCCLAFALIRKTADSIGSKRILHDQAIPFYHQREIAIQWVLNGPGIVFDADGEALYKNFLEPQIIALWQAQAPSPQKNGFIESFERRVRTEYMVAILRSDHISSIEDIQNDFAAWLARFNSDTKLPGFPNMGRSPLEVFQTLKPLPLIKKKTQYRQTAIKISPIEVIAPTKVPYPTKKVKSGESKTESGRWIFRIVNTVLICLATLLGWTIVSELFNAQNQKLSSISIASVNKKNSPLFNLSKHQAPHLDGFEIVLERNLFGLSRATLNFSSDENFEVAAIAVEEKDVGLKLVGTTVTNNSKLNYAIIDINKTREQRIFKENERVGKLIIRKIFRNNIIIENENGQHKRLTVEPDPFKKTQPDKGSIPLTYQSLKPTQESTEIRESAVTIKLPLDMIQSSLSNISALIEEVKISPHISNGNQEGVSISRISPQNVLARMGLRSGDVIKELNGEEITDLADAEAFFQTLLEGGSHTIVYERRGRSQKLELSIN